MSDEAALLSAITAHAGDDTPRLVYADWLDEHDAPIQAEFIRTQCRLASASAADPEYPDLLERSAEVAIRFGLALKLTLPQLPPGFVTGALESPNGRDLVRRGFLSTAFGEWSRHPYASPHSPDDEQLDRVCDGLAPLVATTTVRHLCLYGMSPDALARVLASPGADALTGLSISPGYAQDTGNALLAVIARAKSLANLERLELLLSATATGLSALAGANLPRLRDLDFPMLTGSAGDLAPVLKAKWFRNLRRAKVNAIEQGLQKPLLAALAEVPHLDALDITFEARGALQVLGSAGGFPALAQLGAGSYPASDRLTTHLARGRFPRLAGLELSALHRDTFAPLLRARWLPQLRVLDLSYGSLRDPSVVALSRSAAAPALRALKIGNNPLTRHGLLALADGARFPALTTLDLRSNYTRAAPATVAAFAAALSHPNLRALNLGGWSLGDAGAKALAANPRLGNLARLLADGCGLNDRGFTALARSRHLRQLLELDVGSNNLKRAAALLNPEALPRLAKVELSGNAIKPADRDALHRVRGWLV